MNGPHDVGGVGFDGILVAATHDGLRSHVNDHIGTALGYRSLEPRKVANVRANGADASLATSACSNRLGWVGGSSAYPVTLAPSASSHSDSQLPLKPVCPVRKTLRPFQNERLSMIGPFRPAQSESSERRDGGMPILANTTSSTLRQALAASMPAALASAAAIVRSVPARALRPGGQGERPHHRTRAHRPSKHPDATRSLPKGRSAGPPWRELQRRCR